MAAGSPPRRRVALLGCGAMGSQIARAIDGGRVRAELVRVYDMDAARAESLASSMSARRPEVVANAHLLSSGPGVDIVVEAASQEAVRTAALSVLQNRKDLLVMSVGALLDEAVFDVLADACRQYGRTLVLPSGAVAGIDCLKAVREELESVTLTTTKHPDSLRGAPFFERTGTDPSSISAATTIFDGTAAEAVAQFPANVNVAAALALAGLGAASTRVRVVADPSAARNRHEIAASGRFGDLSVVVRNVPDPSNPRTSRLAALSAIEALRAACEPGGVRRGT